MARTGRPGSCSALVSTSPVAQVLMGHTFPEGEQGVAWTALAFLANHPATHRHLATKLVQHFVADTPPLGCHTARSRASCAIPGAIWAKPLPH